MVLLSAIRCGSGGLTRTRHPKVDGVVREIVDGMALDAAQDDADAVDGAGLHMVVHAETPEVAAIIAQVTKLESVTAPEVVVILTRAMTGRYTGNQLELARRHARDNAQFCFDLQAYYAAVASGGPSVDVGDVVVCLQAACPPVSVGGLPAHTPSSAHDDDGTTIAVCTDAALRFVDGLALQELAIETMMGDTLLSSTVNETQLRAILRNCAAYRTVGVVFPDLGVALVGVHFNCVQLDDAIAGGYASFCAMYCGALIAALHVCAAECDIPVEKCWVVGDLDLRTGVSAACASATSAGLTLFDSGTLQSRAVGSEPKVSGGPASRLCVVARDTANGAARVLTGDQTVDAEWAAGRAVLQAVILTDCPFSDDYYIRMQKYVVGVSIIVYVIVHAILFFV